MSLSTDPATSNRRFSEFLKEDGWSHPALEQVGAIFNESLVISPEMGRLLARLVVDGGCRNVVEFGAGSSSLVLANALSHVGGGHLTSLEQMPEWCREKWRQVVALSEVDAQLLKFTVRPTAGPRGVYMAAACNTARLKARGPFDLVFIDAPQWFYGRDGSLHRIFPFLAPGATIVLDDASRWRERKTIRRWISLYPGLRLVGYDAKYGNAGAAILRLETPAPPRISLHVMLSSTYDFLRSTRARRLGERRMNALLGDFRSQDPFD